MAADPSPRASGFSRHAGRFVPYASHRFAELARVFRPEAAKPADILASFQRFYFDTALSSSPAALPSLKVFAEEGHILFGTDFPFARAAVAASFTTKLDKFKGLTVKNKGRSVTETRWPCFPAWPRDTTPESRKTRLH